MLTSIGDNINDATNSIDHISLVESRKVDQNSNKYHVGHQIYVAMWIKLMLTQLNSQHCTL